ITPVDTRYKVNIRCSTRTKFNLLIFLENPGGHNPFLPLPMDTKRFYGAKTVGIPKLSGSEDENLSDDDFYRKTFSQVLVEDTSEEEQLDREMVEDNVIEESDFSDSEDDVPLSTLIAANKAKKKNKDCFDWDI
ncbi:unnamed protein product, partial [Acanthoscelides obtectus]